jgi:hypothetical protein
MILHVREIPECLDSYKALPIDRAYFTGFTEKQLEKPIAEFIRKTDYDYYWLVSDDVIATRDAFDRIQRGLGSHDIVTGYALNPDGSMNVCLCDYPLDDWPPTSGNSYRWMSKFALDSYPGDYVPTYYVPFILSAMKREVWLEVPFGTYSILPARFSKYFRNVRAIRGWACDYHFSLRLQKKGIKAYAAKGALMEHLGSSAFRPTAHHLNLGEVEPSVELLKCES